MRSQDAATKAKEGLKRERARAKRIEKLLEAAQGEIAQLKTKVGETSISVWNLPFCLERAFVGWLTAVQSPGAFFYL